METKEKNEGYKTVEPSEFANVIKSPDVYLIDVRTADDFKEGHIEGAHLLDVQSPDFLKNAEATLPKDKTIAVYCRTGKRSALASTQLSENGYKIINLDGGITNWEENDLPVVK